MSSSTCVNERAPVNSMADLDVGLEGWGGDLTYRIGGMIVFPDGSTESTHFPLSELEFPLEVLLL